MSSHNSSEQQSSEQQIAQTNGATDLVDPFGRTVRDLRISVTDRCNFRCQYCMPAEGMKWLPRSEILNFSEIERFAKVCVERFGFNGIRLTGGEPLVRAHLPLLVEKLAALGVDVALTTNGSTLNLHAQALADAGLSRINISLDSLQRERFLELTRRDELDRVLAGIDAAIAAGLSPVKINTVMMRGINDDEVLDFAHFGRERGVIVRFIEFMPLEAGDVWNESRVVPATEIVETLATEFDVQAVKRGSEPAEKFLLSPQGANGTETNGTNTGKPGTSGSETSENAAENISEVGVIASVTKPFCGNCDRVRLTAEGQFRTCLFALDEFDMRAILRPGEDGASEGSLSEEGSVKNTPGKNSSADLDNRLAEAIAAAVGTKWAGHSIGKVHFIKPARTMSQVGG